MFTTAAKVLTIHSVLYRCRKLAIWSKKHLRGHFIAIIISRVQFLHMYKQYTNIQILKIHSNTKTTSEYPNGANIHCIAALIYIYIYNSNFLAI